MEGSDHNSAGQNDLDDDDGLYGSQESVEEDNITDDPQSDGYDLYLDSESADPNTPGVNTANTHKRKLDEETTVSSFFSGGELTDNVKRQRLGAPAPSLNDLPIAVLQRMLTFLSPLTLIKCLGTCRRLRSCLTSEAVTIDTDRPGSLKAIGGNAVWRTSRETFCSTLPKPLGNVSEMRMLGLILGQRCEICDRLPTLVPQNTLAWNRGPGREAGNVGVRTVWPFAARLCGDCFDKSCIKDVEVIVTPDKVFLPALPFVLRTADMHYVPPMIVQGRLASIPPNVQLSKVYYRPALETLRKVREDLSHVSATEVQAWLSDISVEGPGRALDSNRWVQWEFALPNGLSARQAVLGMDRAALVAPHLMGAAKSTAPGVSEYGRGLPNHYSTATSLSSGEINTPPVPPQFTASNPHAHSGYSFPVDPASRGSSYNDPNAHSSERSKGLDEINRLVAARRAEIERLCFEDIQPPLYPNVLEHIPQFKAALQIPRPFTDQDWRILKPRLLQKRLEAERAAYLRSLDFNTNDYVNSITHRTLKRSGKGNVVTHDDAQKSIRLRLIQIAKDVLEERWDGGSRLSFVDAPNFAADMITTTMSRFYEANNPEYGSSETLPVLDTVKQVFDTIVKPSLDRVRCKEMFMCPECDDQTKFYTFEGIIQHFGAKHESDFSLGNVVVSWSTAIWPEDPPFVTHPVPSRRVPPVYAQSAIMQRKLARTASDDPRSDVQNEVPQASFLASLHVPFQDAAPSAESDDEYDPEEAYAPEQWQSKSQSRENDRSNAHVEPSAALMDLLDKYVVSGPTAPQSYPVEQRGKVSALSREMLVKTSGLNGFPDAARLYVILFHMDRLFQQKYGKPMSIGCLRESLRTRPDMSRFRKWTHLSCKLCTLIKKQPGAQTLASRLLKWAEPNQSLSSILEHFEKTHGNSNYITDMLELPTENQMRGFTKSKNMTEAKLKMIASALPANLLPDGVPALTSEYTSNESDDSLPPAEDDEYDPRRPIVIRPQTPKAVVKPTPKAQTATPKIKRDHNTKRDSDDDGFDYSSFQIPAVMRSENVPEQQGAASSDSESSAEAFIPAVIKNEAAIAQTRASAQRHPSEPATSLQSYPNSTIGSTPAPYGASQSIPPTNLTYPPATPQFGQYAAAAPPPPSAQQGYYPGAPFPYNAQQMGYQPQNPYAMPQMAHPMQHYAQQQQQPPPPPAYQPYGAYQPGLQPQYQPQPGQYPGQPAGWPQQQQQQQQQYPHYYPGQQPPPHQ